MILNTLMRSLPGVLALLTLVMSAAPVLASVDGVDSTAPHLWSQIKEDAYSQREHFATGADKLAARLKEQIAEIIAKRASMTSDTNDWDLAFKEVEQSRLLLADRIGALGKANTPETWVDAKQKVGEAWKRAQLAVDRMNSTRSS